MLKLYSVSVGHDAKALIAQTGIHLVFLLSAIVLCDRLMSAP